MLEIYLLILLHAALCLLEEQWLQFDIGPPTLVTGLVTRGRGDGRRKHWVTRFRVSYSNSTNGEWLYYKDANHLEAKVFAAQLFLQWEARANLVVCDSGIVNSCVCNNMTQYFVYNFTASIRYRPLSQSLLSSVQ